MSLELEWRCPDCKRVWIADFTQIVCRDCGGERPKLAEHELVLPKPAVNINMGDLIVGSFRTVEG